MSYLELAKRSLEEIRSRAVTSAGCSLEQTADEQPSRDLDYLAAMSLSDFAHAGLIVKVHSGVLNCKLIFVSDNVPRSEVSDLGFTVYRAAEMKKLAIWRTKPDCLRRVVKDIFGKVYGATTITTIERKAVRMKKHREGTAKKAK